MSKYLKTIEESLQNLNEENVSQIIEKATEFGFEIDSGEPSLRESLLNLNQCVGTVALLMNKNVLRQLPLGIQRSLTEIIQELSGYVTGILGGSQQHSHLISSIDKLYSWLWKHRLLEINDEEINYLEKLNQLKSIEGEALRIVSEIKSTLALRDDLKNVLDTANTLSSDAESNLVKATEALTKIEKVLANSTAFEQQISAVEKTVEETRTKVLSNATSAAESETEVTRIENRIREFFAAIDDNKTKLETALSETKAELSKLTTSASTTLATHAKDTQSLIKELKELESEIADAIKKATGFSLFHSFQTRRDSLRYSRIFWLFATLALSFVAVFLAYSIATTNIPSEWDIALALKVLTGIPLAFVIWFCSMQYGRERRLEEEYAFKSNISISLVPYKDLVQEFVTDGNSQKFFDFLIQSVSEVFVSPTEKVFQKDRGVLFSSKSLKTVEAITKLVQDIKAKP